MEPLDWAARWMAARQASPEGAMRAKRDPVAFWNRKAEWFARNTAGDTVEPSMLTSTIELTRDMDVLDIGAGTGRFAIPLARLGRSVTAVEPSSGMAGFMRERATREGIDNVTIVPKRWEDVVIGKDVDPHEVVLAAYSLDVDDMWGAIEKIIQVSTAYAFIFTWVIRTLWDFDTLWPMVHWEPYIPGPGYIYIVNMLHDAGIHANVRVVAREKDKVFDSIQAALEDVKELLFVDDDESDAVLTDHLKNVLEQHADGTFHQHGTSERVMIWWPVR